MREYDITHCPRVLTTKYLYKIILHMYLLINSNIFHKHVQDHANSFFTMICILLQRRVCLYKANLICIK